MGRVNRLVQLDIAFYHRPFSAGKLRVPDIGEEAN